MPKRLRSAALRVDRDVAELTDLWVDPAAMRRGVGRRLFEHAAGVAAVAGASLLRIESDPHAEAFYLHLGATRVGDAPSVPPGRTIPVLSLALGSAREGGDIATGKIDPQRGTGGG
jgi:GNAT superfamily N-acetyltransferase